MTLRYTIPLPLYQAYSQIVAGEKFKKNRKKNAVTSMVELLVAVLVSLWVFTSKEKNQLAIILCVVLLGLAIYSFLFYRYIFPRTIGKNAAENYRKSQYLQNEVALAFYPDRLLEESLGQEKEYRWKDLTRLVETPGLYVLELGESRTLLLPKESLGEDKYLAEEFFATLCQKYHIKQTMLG